MDAQVTTVQAIARSAGVLIITRGSGEYIRSVDVEPFLEAARARGVAVLGVEGFRLSKDSTVPDMDAILDLFELEHEPEFVERSIAQALTFAREMGNPELYFEFALERVTR